MSRLMGNMTNTSQGSRQGTAGYMAVGMPQNTKCTICDKMHYSKSSPKCSKAKQSIYAEQRRKDSEMGWPV